MSAMRPYESGRFIRATFSSRAVVICCASRRTGYLRGAAERWSGGSVSAPLDAELAHACTQRVRVDRELARGAERPVDPALARGERVLDVAADHVVERLDRRGVGRGSGRG